MTENVHPKKLTPRQRKAITALIGGFNQSDAAAAAGVGSKTIQRWLKDPVFIGELDKRTGAAVAAATRRLAGTLDLAVDTFRAVMEDGHASQALRLRAANYAAAHAVKLLETSEILRRMEAIEAALGISQ